MMCIDPELYWKKLIWDSDIPVVILLHVHLVYVERRWLTNQERLKLNLNEF